MNPIFVVTNALVEWPFLALLPAGAFFLLYRRHRVRGVLVAGIAWLIYCLYEYGMWLGLLCSGECNIRVDLLLIFPLLIILSAVGVFKAARSSRNTSNATRGE